MEGEVKGPAWTGAAMKLWVALMPALLVIAWLTSCSPGQGKPAVRLDEGFVLSIGQRVRVEGDDLQIGFLDVVADSRCPKDVTGVWAGELKYLVELISP